MIERHIKEVIDYSIKHFPCVIVTGPRQVGKSTLLTKKYENNGFSYVSLDDTTQRMLARNDPKTFLEIHSYPLIIDEAQKATELFDEIASRRTISEHFSKHKAVRVNTINLLPIRHFNKYGNAYKRMIEQRLFMPLHIDKRWQDLLPDI